MPQATAARKPKSETDAADRLRLLALGLCAWHDADPVGCSRLRGQAPKRENNAKTLTAKETDALLLRLERESDDALLGERDDQIVVDLEAYQRHKAHPFWQRLDLAMTVLQIADPWAHKLIVHVYVAAGGPVRAIVRAHALKFLTDGGDAPVAAPRYDLVAAMMELDRLVGETSYPQLLHEQVAGWEQWLATARALLGTVGTPKERSKGARRALRELVREAVNLGFSQSEVARRFGVNQSTVSRIVNGLDV